LPLKLALQVRLKLVKMVAVRSGCGHLTIGNNVRIQAQSGVGRNVKDEEVLQGSPTFGYNDYSKSYIFLL
jgi:UDP-3-O-[3-hydroxymyristoyl] glucosamine N-acyltransferase